MKNGRISNFQGLVTSTMDRVMVHTSSSCITHRPQPTCQISLKSKKLFVDEGTNVRTHVLTYIHRDGHLRPTLLGRVGRVNLNSCYCLILA